MCAACGIATHVPDDSGAVAVAERPRKFAALRNKDCRPYLFGAGLAFGLAQQQHPTMLLLWPVFLGYVVWRGRAFFRTRWAYAAIVAFLIGSRAWRALPRGIRRGRGSAAGTDWRPGP